MNKRNIEKLRLLIKAISKPDPVTLYKLTEANTRFQVQGRLLNRAQLSTIHQMLFGACNNKSKPEADILEIKEIISSGEVDQLTAIIKLANNSMSQQLWYATVTFQNNAILSITLFTPSARSGPIHKIRSVNEEIYWIQESEIIYIESRHNNVEYICSSNFTITSCNSLHNLESILSHNFIRIHRCYIVNKTHIKCIRRCEVVMSNDAILPIPGRKYTEVKKLLTD